MKRWMLVIVAVMLGWFASNAARADVARFCAGCNFAGASLQSSDFSNATYVGTNFQKANLSGSSFRNARLIAANFEHADLRNAAFDGADCIACNFDGALLDGATFSKVRMVAANFSGFKSAVGDQALRDLLSGCISCNFRQAALSKHDLTGVSLISVDLSQADLRGTNFTNAVLCWYNGNGAQRATLCDTMKDAQTAGTILRGATLCDDPLDRAGCSPVPPATLREKSGSALDGADLSQP